MLRQHLYAILFICWMVFVTFSSLYSFEGDDLSIINIQHGDKIVHFTFYFVAAVLGFLFLNEQQRKKAQFIYFLILFAFILAFFGIIIEVIQEKCTVSRAGEVLDALANSLGAIVGITTMYLLFYRQSWLK